MHTAKSVLALNCSGRPLTARTTLYICCYRGLSDSDLVKLGIVDAPSQRQRGGRGAGAEGIFQAEQLRALLVGLVCTADAAQTPSDGNRQLFEDFDFIEGHPYVRRARD